MKKAKHRACSHDRVQDDGLSRIYRAAWLYGGIPFLILTSIFIAARRGAGLADFLFWLAVIWIALVRYVEASCWTEGFLQPSRAALGQWWRFSVIFGVAAGILYALAKILGKP